MTKIKTLTDVVDWRLCIGCGACASVCPNNKVELWDFLHEGIRPVVDDKDCGSCSQCLEVCPGLATDFTPKGQSVTGTLQGNDTFQQDWGQVLEIWEGHASDPEIRYKGSSGGVLTALAAFCIEQGGMHGVLHTAQHSQDPIRNQTRLSLHREELIAATGSRYSPAAVCDSLVQVENAPAPCVVIGKPSDIAALTKARQSRPNLDAKVGLTLSFFCAETPSTGGTIALLEKLQVTPSAVADLRYRGYGWPGYFAPVCHGDTEAKQKLPYRDSWKFLTAHRPWFTNLWPDGSGELADISCGDPWYEKPDGNNPGFSIIAVRTEVGRKILHAAIEAGYLKITRAEPWKLAKSQESLAKKRAATWGRILAMRLFGLPVPSFPGAPLYRCWSRLSFREKLKSVVGTARRIWQRKLFRPLKLDHSTATRVEPRT